MLFLKCLRLKTANSSEPLLCSLIFDEMSIRKHVQWNGTETVGFIDLGTGLDDSSRPVATEVLMFIIVPLNSVWKMPIAYFLTDGLTADVKLNLVVESIKRLHAVNVRVTSLVCDGPSTNFSVATKLGASITVEDMRPYFIHPDNSTWKVHVIFDAAHMLKLIRNTLAEKNILANRNGKQIRWQHIVDLHELQDKEGLRAANKLKRGHIEWFQQKMKVSLTVQTLSRSVAKALEFASNDLKLTKFADVSATVEFIYIFDRLFDTLNSRHPMAKEYKSVMKPSNEQYWRPFLTETVEYLTGLKLADRPLHETPRKTPVLGFLATINSVVALYDEFVGNGSLKYLATYRLSQDHIELTFNVVRSRGRWNNNPTAIQFQAAYRRLVMKHDIRPSQTGNAVSQDSVTLLPALAVVNSRESVVATPELLLSCGLSVTSGNNDHDYSVTADKINLSEFSSNIVVYIAGYVVRKLLKKLLCIACRVGLLDSTKVNSNYKLLMRKDAGGLLFPSQSVVTVCTVTEQCLRFISGCAEGSVPQQKNIRLCLQMAVLERMRDKQLFVDTASNDEHSCTQDLLDCYPLTLIRLIVNEYVTIRMHWMAKTFTDKIKGKNVRFNSNKQVLFANQ